ncbi:MAG: UDP-3-O-(3-hydroxymyristoyl)glucosamine N-acyltransferase, partial [Armatimonadota bacterium]|nr:UDP-3-O-(3-hydroxymyristoyl)glucosamine N-acyltransferase [Armatimonadota bacterium]
RIGEHCILAGQTGLSGTATLEDYVVMAGQVGVAPHARIGRGTQVGGQSGVHGTVEAGSVISGSPARDHRETRRISAAMGRLPDMLQTLRELKKRVEELERRLSQG